MKFNFKTIRLAFIVLLMLLLANSFFIVQETEQALLMQFGRPVSSKIDAGLYIKTPFIQNVIKVEKRVMEWDGAATEIPTKGMKDTRVSNDKRNKQETTNIFIDTYARWRINDPLKFYTRLNNQLQAQSRLDGIIDGKIRDKIAPRYINDLVDEGGVIMEEALFAVKEELISLDLGIEVIDIQIKRVTFNDKIMPKVFDRMASEQEAEAAKFEGQGKAKKAEIVGISNRDADKILSMAKREAKIIEGVADSTAAAIFASTYSADPEFYELWRTWKILPGAMGSKSELWLSTNNYPNSNLFGVSPDDLSK